jgi:hypothetical protein
MSRDEYGGRIGMTEQACVGYVGAADQGSQGLYQRASVAAARHLGTPDYAPFSCHVLYGRTVP